MLNSQSVLRNDVGPKFVLLSTVSLRFVLSRVLFFLYSLGPMYLLSIVMVDARATTRVPPSQHDCDSCGSRPGVCVHEHGYC